MSSGEADGPERYAESFTWLPDERGAAERGKGDGCRGDTGVNFVLDRPGITSCDCESDGVFSFREPSRSSASLRSACDWVCASPIYL